MKTLSDAARVMRALSDVTRLRIVQELLKNAELTVGQIVAILGVSQPCVSKHLRVLREAGIVASEKRRTLVVCRVDITPHSAWHPLGRFLEEVRTIPVA